MWETAISQRFFSAKNANEMASEAMELVGYMQKIKDPCYCF